MRRSVVPACVALVLVLTGCTAGNDAQSSPTPTRTATATPTPTATPSPNATSPVPEPEASAATASCDTVLTAEEYSSLEEDGLTLSPDTRAFDATMQSLMDAGFGCYWKPDGGDVQVWYAQATQDDATWAAQKQQLLDDGWTQTDDPFAGVLRAPSDYDPSYLPVVVNSDGITYYASYPEFFGSVTALQG